MPRTPHSLPGQDLRLVEVRMGEFGLMAQEQSYGSTTRMVFDCDRHTHAIRLDKTSALTLARLLGVELKNMPAMLESYLYQEDNQLSDLMDLLDIKGIPYHYSIRATADGRKPPHSRAI